MGVPEDVSIGGHGHENTDRTRPLPQLTAACWRGDNYTLGFRMDLRPLRHRVRANNSQVVSDDPL